MYVPTKIFLTIGAGRHKDYLSSFGLSVRNAGIEIYNHVNVRSIFPPGCRRISKNE